MKTKKISARLIIRTTLRQVLISTDNKRFKSYPKNFFYYYYGGEYLHIEGPFGLYYGATLKSTTVNDTVLTEDNFSDLLKFMYRIYVTSYNQLTDKPYINGVKVEGQQQAEYYKLQRLLREGTNVSIELNADGTATISAESPFLGEYLSLEALEAAFPEAKPGQYAIVDEGEDSDAIKYIWDSSDNKWVSSGPSGDETPESIKEKYESNSNTNAFTDEEKEKLEAVYDPSELGEGAFYVVGKYSLIFSDEGEGAKII